MDRLANMLNAIKNAGYAHRTEVFVPYSKFKHAVARSLFDEGYVAGFEKVSRNKGGDQLKVTVKFFENGDPRVSNVKRISKSSRRIYKGHDEMHQIRQGFGHLFVSTPKGIMTSIAARKAHVGGEVLFEIW